MAASHHSSVQDQMADVTECSICAEVYTNPKILPCVHTFCLQCLEKYGKDKKTGDQMACPICRSEFFIPNGGLCSLPHNFFISKMVEIRTLSETSTNEALCGICPEEERVRAKLFCFECEQNLCERCGSAHKKIKLCQNHQVVEIGRNLKTQDVTIRNSYCDQHPGELVKMYCEDDKATICFLCFAENHQSHKCLNVTKASEEFSYSLKNDLKNVLEGLPEIQTSLQKCENWKKVLLAQIVDAERQILDEAVRLKVIIDSHANLMTQKLIALKSERLKKIEIMNEDVERFKVTIETYRRYSDELLNKGAPGDICREADQLKARARELASLMTDFSARDFKCYGVIFKSLNLEYVLSMNSIANVIGDVQDVSVNDCFKPPVTHDAVVLDATPVQQVYEITPVKMQPHSLVSQGDPDIRLPKNTESGIVALVTLIFDSKTMQFIKRRPELKENIEGSLEKLNCSVEWTCKEKVEMKLKYKGTENQKPIPWWGLECQKVFQIYADEITSKTDSIPEEMWDGLKNRIEEHTAQKSNLLDFDFDSGVFEIQYIGLKKDTEEFEQILQNIKTEFEEEQRNQRISENVTYLKPHQSDLIITEVFQMKLRQEVPGLELEVKESEVNLCGTRDVVKRARLYILDTVTEVFENSFEISESISKVFAKGEVKPHVMQRFDSAGICASWMYKDRNVVVFALDDKNLNEAINVLKDVVVEARLPLSAVHLPKHFGRSYQWMQFIYRQCQECRSLEVNVNDSFIVVACWKSLIEQFKRRIEYFACKNTMPGFQNNALIIANKWQ